MTVVLFASLIVLLMLDIPISFCLLISSLIALIYADVDPIIVGLQMSQAMASFYPFIAVPFFMLAGELMNKGGLSHKIVDFATVLVGHRRGGMGMVTVLSSLIFGGISGASSADTAAIGSIMIPAMRRAGYPAGFATALAACAGSTGAMIPPSIVMILCGVIGGISIEKLFMAGVLPGILVGLALMTACYRFAVKHELPVAPKADTQKLLSSGLAAIWAIVLVVIIIGGIRIGIFTATEASAVAVIYALFVGIVIYRQLKLRDIPEVVVTAAKTSAALSFLICTAVLFGWVVTYGDVPRVLTGSLISTAEWIVSPLSNWVNPDFLFTLKKIVVLLALNLALLLLGMFLDAGPALIILIPVLMPLTGQLQMNPVHFGVMVVINLIIGVLSPPVGTTLFVACGIAKIRIAEVVPYMLHLLVFMIVIQLAITFIPPITLFMANWVQ